MLVSFVDYRFTRFKPSDIAFSSLVAAASILYPHQYQNILKEERTHISQETTQCMELMIEFCNNMGFRIAPAESEVVTGQSAPSAEPTRVEIRTEKEEAGNKGKGILRSLDESVEPTGVVIPTETEEAGNKGKGTKQSSGEEDRTPAGSVSSDTMEESIMAAAEVEKIPLAAKKEITLAAGVATTSAANELTNKLMTFELRWKEIVGLDLTIDPLPPTTDNASEVNCRCNCTPDSPFNCCNIL